MTNILKGIKCPVLFQRLLTQKSRCEYSSTALVKSFKKISAPGVVFPQGVSGAIVVGEDRLDLYNEIFMGNHIYWKDFEYKESTTVFTPIHNDGVRLTLTWKPNRGEDLSREGWVESDLCPSIGGWVRVTARTEDNLSTLLSIPPAKTLKEASVVVKKIHSTISVVGPYGLPTGETPPTDADIPKAEGRHLVTNGTKWWIVDTVRCE